MPVVEAGVVHRSIAGAGIVQQDIERALGQKKLVGGVVDFLSTEVPNV
ncbi:MAG: hypothetical protein IPN76_31355 [Saprospiraceae bacterium]|nr:hypothetical protein [Saprospiraceae bacterium]